MTATWNPRNVVIEWRAGPECDRYAAALARLADDPSDSEAADTVRLLCPEMGTGNAYIATIQHVRERLASLKALSDPESRKRLEAAEERLADAEAALSAAQAERDAAAAQAKEERDRQLVAVRTRELLPDSYSNAPRPVLMVLAPELRAAGFAVPSH